MSWNECLQRPAQLLCVDIVAHVDWFVLQLIQHGASHLLLQPLGGRVVSGHTVEGNQLIADTNVLAGAMAQVDWDNAEARLRHTSVVTGHLDGHSPRFTLMLCNTESVGRT